MPLASQSRQLSVPPLVHLEGHGDGSLGGRGVEVSSPPPLSMVPLPIPSYSPASSVKGTALHGEVLSLFDKGVIELAPPSPGYYSRLFVVWKAMGSWRPVIGLLLLNRFVQPTRFRMETNQSVLRVLRRDEWMFSIDLNDTYLQVPVHPDSCHYPQFLENGQVFQFKALCFGLSMAPQVFTRVMAPVSVILHGLGIRILQYLDDWLVLASSRVEALWARDKVFSLCHQLSIVVNYASSHLVPSCSATYLGMFLASPSLKAFPSPERVSTLHSQLNEFLSCWQQGVIAWRSLLGQLSSLCLLVPGGRLRMRSLQLELRRLWDFLDESVVLSWTPEIARVLEWWYDTDHLLQGVSLEVQHPDLLFWSDSLDQGWGAHIHDRFVSDQWSDAERSLFINFLEPRAIRLGLHHFGLSLRGLSSRLGLVIVRGCYSKI